MLLVVKERGDLVHVFLLVVMQLVAVLVAMHAGRGILLELVLAPLVARLLHPGHVALNIIFIFNIQLYYLIKYVR